MKYLPLFFQFDDKPCLLVGGGTVALRKAKTLLKAQATLIVLAPELNSELTLLYRQNAFQWKQKNFQSSDVENCCLVIAATNDEKINQEVSQAAKTQNIPVNVVDSPSLSTVIFPSIVDRDPVTIAISTGGSAPVLARLLRSKIETLIPTYYGDLARLVDKYRSQVKLLLPDIEQRKAFWEKVLSSPLSEHLLSNQQNLAEQRLDNLLQQLKKKPDELIYQGEVYLVGAGPGDPDLLTFKALRLLQQADVVLYDRLVSESIVDLARKDAEKIYVGKSRLLHSLPQEQINELLVRLAKEGKRVCRLKGGDPFIFGRGGEEIETLVDHKVSFQVVPGITAASGCAAYAGIPLTHRDYAQSVLFVTGHRRKEHVETDIEASNAVKSAVKNAAKTQPLDWASFNVAGQTLVFYMGLSEIDNICQGLTGAGMNEQMPVALIQQGTTKNQKVWVSNLRDLPELVKNTEVKAPTLIIVGEVVRLREKLNWFG